MTQDVVLHSEISLLDTFEMSIKHKHVTGQALGGLYWNIGCKCGAATRLMFIQKVHLSKFISLIGPTTTGCSQCTQSEMKVHGNNWKGKKGIQPAMPWPCHHSLHCQKSPPLPRSSPPHHQELTDKELEKKTPGCVQYRDILYLSPGKPRSYTTHKVKHPPVPFITSELQLSLCLSLAEQNASVVCVENCLLCLFTEYQ